MTRTRATITATLAASTAFLGLLAHSYGQQAWSATLAAESDPSLPLGWVTGLVVDSRNRVYVTDGAWDGIVILDADLSFEQEVGRKGEGPGEFELPATIQILAGDSLYVFDGNLARVTVFEPQALTVAYTVTLPPVHHPFAVWRIAGQRGYVGIRSRPFYPGQSESEDQDRLDVVFSLGTDGETELDSIYVAPSAQALIVRSGGSVMVGDHPFGSEPFISLLGDDRLVYANSRFPSVMVLNLDGGLHHSFAVPAKQLPVRPAELRASIENAQAVPFARALEQGVPYMWPALTGLIVDDEERIWVGARSESMSDQWEWTAFTAEGGAVGSVLLPSAFELYAVRAGRLFGVVTNELGVPRINVYRLEEE